MHLSCLFAGEFFPKWLHTLSLWLSSPTADFSEVCVYVYVCEIILLLVFYEYSVGWLGIVRLPVASAAELNNYSTADVPGLVG